LDDKVEQTEIMSIESGSGVRIAYPSSWRVPQNRPCLNSLSGQSKDAKGRKRGGPSGVPLSSPNCHEDFRGASPRNNRAFDHIVRINHSCNKRRSSIG
jgi:hypothetical protein